MKNAQGIPLPDGSMQPIGYVVMQHATRKDRPVKAYSRWIERIPDIYRAAIEGKTETEFALDGSSAPGRVDPNQLHSLRHYRSLMPLAQDARKPMFHLKAADGAIGAHANAVQDCYVDFKNLARRLAEACQVRLATT